MIWDIHGEVLGSHGEHNRMVQGHGQGTRLSGGARVANLVICKPIIGSTTVPFAGLISWQAPSHHTIPHTPLRPRWLSTLRA